MTPKMCEECQGACQPLASSHNIKASEWHCTKCRKSYPMDADTANEILRIEASQRRR